MPPRGSVRRPRGGNGRRGRRRSGARHRIRPGGFPQQGRRPSPARRGARRGEDQLIERRGRRRSVGARSDHNDGRQHADRAARTAGGDIGAPGLGDRIFERVASYLREARPDALPRLDGLYAGLRPCDDIMAYLKKPLAERRENAARARQALDLVGASGADGDARAWAVQHARNIADTFEFATLDLADPASVSAAEQLRDRVMADNTAWWERRTGGKVLLSAHNGHTGYLATDTFLYPEPQGSHLRDTYGKDYVAVGFTFDSGSFLTNDGILTDAWKAVTVPPATPEMNEHTLDRVRHRDYYVDLRTAPRAARDWLDVSRPTYEAGSVYRTDPRPELAIGRAYDVLIHLNRVTQARMF
ncbi:erythromycin esterase family protein [Kitasatospora purpeofusca]|uniref:erythromycin esterase family protein n=1 Tax=Kitasatospora purpeofusca TaxID=67352 RepID=UPI0036CAB752